MTHPCAPRAHLPSLQADKMGCTPLHHAAAARHPATRLLLAACPEAARMASLDGGLPVHILCSAAGPLEDLHALLDAHPDGLWQAAACKWTALHHAAAGCACPASAGAGERAGVLSNGGAGIGHGGAAAAAAIAEELLRRRPKAARELTAARHSALSLCLGRHGSPALAALLLRAWPEAASTPATNGWYPLHYAAFRPQASNARDRSRRAAAAGGAKAAISSAMLPLVRQLLDLCPAALVAELPGGHNPLMLACRAGAPPDVIIELLRADEDAARARSSLAGRTALHYACASGCGADVLEALLRVHPHAAAQADARERLPLAQLMRCRPACTPEALQALLAAHPGAASVATPEDGALPLHAAIAGAPSPAVMRLLLQADPDTATALRGDGRTPLQLAVHLRRDASVVDELLRWAPSEALARLPTGEPSLLAAASARGTPVGAVAALWAATPDTCVMPGGEDLVQQQLPDAWLLLAALRNRAWDRRWAAVCARALAGVDCDADTCASWRDDAPLADDATDEDPCADADDGGDGDGCDDCEGFDASCDGEPAPDGFSAGLFDGARVVRERPGA